MCKVATWRSMEPERWGECREKGGRRSDRERRSSARCYCPVCQSLEGTNKENWWAVAYHMSALLSLTLCSVIHSCTRYIHSGKCVTPLHLSCLPTLLTSVLVSPDLLPNRPILLPALFTVSRYDLPLQRQVRLEQVEGRHIDAGRKGWWEEEEETPVYPPGKEVTARPVHPTPVRWCQGGVDREEWG